MPKSFLKSLGNTFVGGLLQTGFGQLNNAINYNRQLDFWNRQNEYNSPLAQRQRLQKAGFNPSAFSGEVASSSPAQGLSSINQDNPEIDSLNESLMLFGQLEQMSVGNRLTESQIELAAIEYVVKNAEAFNLQMDGAEKAKLLKYVEDEKIIELYEALSRISKNEAETQTEEETRQPKVENIKADTALKESQSANLDKSTDLLDKQIQWYDANQAAGLELIRAQVANLSAETKRNIIGAGTDAILFQRNDFITSASTVFGFDVSNLPPATLTTVLAVYRDILVGATSAREGMRLVSQALKAARTHEVSVLESWGTSYNFMGSGFSESSTKNTNK